MAFSVRPPDEVLDWLRGSGLEIVLLVLGAALATRVVSFLGNKITDRIDENYHDGDALVRSEASKHRHAVAQVITYVVIALIYTLVTISVVTRLGFSITGLVAPATVLGAALGFGAQRIVQDLLAGFFIITERQFGFGDVVRISVVGATLEATGTVEDVTLRVTRLRSSDGEVITLPNGQIVKVINLSRDWARAVVDVPLPVTADVSRVNDVLHEIGQSAFADDELRPLLLDEPSVMGIESLEVDQVSVRMVARTLPGKQFQVGRELRARVAAALRAEGITLPPVVDTIDPVEQQDAL